jgi:hypothetical protein
MTNPTTLNVEEIARGLTKASKRALLRIRFNNWTEEGHPGPSRRDAYSLCWGRDGRHMLAETKAYAIGKNGASWCYALTPLGKRVRAALLKEKNHG